MSYIPFDREYIFTLLTKYFYSDEKLKKLISITVTKSSLWEFGHEGAFIALNLFWEYTCANENAMY